MAKICGVSVGTYNLIENGKRRGSKEAWQKIQAYFNLDGEQMWKLQNPEI
jgi:DNA-binding XRE family transcriptional regulator